MTNVTQLSEPQLTQLTDEMITDYLRDHPDFFERQPELLTQLRIPHQEKGAVSLVEIQLGRLRTRISELEDEITQLMSIAARNDRTFYLLSRVQGDLLSSKSVEQAALVVEEMAAELNLTSCIRLFEQTHPKYSLSREGFNSFSRSHLNGKVVYLGRLRQVDRDALFTDAPDLGSFAILPLGGATPVGLLAFASQDGGHFQPSMDTLFLQQVVSVLNHLLAVWQLSSVAELCDE